MDLLFCSFQFPIDMDHAARFGVVSHMADFDALDGGGQDFWGQFFNVRVVLDGGVDFSAPHALGESPDLLQHIGIEHIVVHPVGLGADFGMGVMIHTQIDIRHPFFQLLSGNSQWVTTAFAEQLPTEQIISHSVR